QSDGWPRDFFNRTAGCRDQAGFGGDGGQDAKRVGLLDFADVGGVDEEFHGRPFRRDTLLRVPALPCAFEGHAAACPYCAGTVAPHCRLLNSVSGMLAGYCTVTNQSPLPTSRISTSRCTWPPQSVSRNVADARPLTISCQPFALP